MKYAKLGMMRTDVNAYTAEDITMRHVSNCCGMKPLYGGNEVANEVGDITVTGILKDENGETIPMAHIVNKTKNTGTTTDMAGLYSFKAGAMDDLEISSIGFETIKIKAGGIGSEIKMKPSVTQLPEVVVTAKRPCPLLCWVAKHKLPIMIGGALVLVGLVGYTLKKSKK